MLREQKTPSGELFGATLHGEQAELAQKFSSCPTVLLSKYINYGSPVYSYYTLSVKIKTVLRLFCSFSVKPIGLKVLRLDLFSFYPLAGYLGN